MDNAGKIEEILRAGGFSDFKRIDPQKDVVFAHWVRFKCMYGCGSYGFCTCCPPAVPPVDVCEKMLREYSLAFIIHVAMQPQASEQTQALTRDFVSLERAVFLAGYHKAFLLPAHRFCPHAENCRSGGERADCANKAHTRPAPEAFGIDVFQTARNAGYAIEVIKARNEVSNRFSFILAE
ncbi:MAG: DUF2284 domain-containing protein [Oscillospiraceae bacterium]|nr:DUF2284 domain-containing protein [Oscillospiraceae bacterium]